MNRAMTSIRVFSSVPLPLHVTDLLNDRVLEVLDTFGVPESLVDVPSTLEVFDALEHRPSPGPEYGRKEIK